MKELTPEQKKFIRENILKMSINDLSLELEVGFSKIKTFVNNNGLKPSPKQVQEIRVAKMNKKSKANSSKQIQNGWWVDAFLYAN